MLTLSSCSIELSMVASHLVWRLRTRDIRARAMEAGQTFDESEECTEWQSKGLDLEQKFSRLFSSKTVPHGILDAYADDNSTDTAVAPEHVVPKTVPNAMV